MIHTKNENHQQKKHGENAVQELCRTTLRRTILEWNVSYTDANDLQVLRDCDLMLGERTIIFGLRADHAPKPAYSAYSVCLLGASDTRERRR